MKILKIQTIRNYKSFVDFSWDKFCKYRPVDGNKKADIKVGELGEFCLFFGENGSGKSSICDILKDLSQYQDFPNTLPHDTEIEIKTDQESPYRFENGEWQVGRLNKNSFLFFDVDFINKNVHTHGERSNLQGQHSQNAGEMIISLDEKANQLKAAIQEKEKEIIDFRDLNLGILKKIFSVDDKNLFAEYKNKTDQDIEDGISKNRENINKIQDAQSKLQRIDKEYLQIGQISTIRHLPVDFLITGKEVYTEIFSRQIKEKSQDQVDEKIKDHFEKHKGFIQKARSRIPEDYENENCPLCMQPLSNASEFIKYYRAAFDEEYESQKKKFLDNIENLKKKLKKMKSDLDNLPREIREVFDFLEGLDNKFKIGIYDVAEKRAYTKSDEISFLEIDLLIRELEKLKSIERKEFDPLRTYGTLQSKIEKQQKRIEAINKLIDDKNRDIVDFKERYSDKDKVTKAIQEVNQKFNEAKTLDSFLNSEKIGDIRKQNQVQEVEEALNDKLKKLKGELKNHLANTIPEGVITRMIDILAKFNLGFTLEHTKLTRDTKDYPFSFTIRDREGNKRDLKDELSEGERQLISLAFFFAMNQDLPNKAEIILVFDDPITSLDAPNLKILADLIHEQMKDFSQVMIFTHHPLFYKYLARRKKPRDLKFGVLKNHETCGGSFVFCDPGFDVIEEVKGYDEEMRQNGQDGDLKPERTALKYAQLLRLAVEKFIKHELLLWDKERNFGSGIIRNLSESKNKFLNLEVKDFGVIMDIYKYCNYSNFLHVDKENPSSLSELKLHIDKFIAIHNKVRVDKKERG